MRLRSRLMNLKSKISKSCNRFISFFRTGTRNVNTTQSSSSTSTLLSCLCFLTTNKEQRMSQIIPRSSSSSGVDDPNLMHSRKMFTLAMAHKPRTSKREHMSKEDGVKEACRRFEDYMIHVIVEEGRTDDLIDMEELLFYWNNLNSPIFIDLVTRFYGELCTELFPTDNDG